MNYQDNKGEAYILICYYAHGWHNFKKSKAKRAGIQGAIRNARVKDIEGIILISKEEYDKWS